ncbi:MAG: indolepyruvate oxidoreductase subunit beta [Eubacteriaceae bacterium]|nr:indolepyruvate oxidoreductase subunit beta [Eubacteriaceae bacterium]
MTNRIMIVGVGGQGTILCGKLLTIALMKAGYDVKMTEIHGMSQRGGSVSSEISYSDKVYSPVTETGGADIIVAFEKLEALRYSDNLKPSGKMIINDHVMYPASVLSAKADYPEDLNSRISEKFNASFLKASEAAKELGNTKVMNIILLGALAKALDLDGVNWDEIIEENVKANFVEINKKAFRYGHDNINL